jgi:L-threonylcarbamoyladenylate synthase
MIKADISAAIKALKEGKVIIYPTDTLYGLGADIFSETAIRKVFEIKKRPAKMPISVAVSDFEEIKKIANVNIKAEILINSFLPGKLTLILKKKSLVSDQITGGLDRVAIRIPDNKIALEILQKFGPITATSANIHGKKTPDIISDIIMQFNKEDIGFCLDDGRLAGQPSTIVDVSEGKINIIRKGAIGNKEILEAVKNG